MPQDIHASFSRADEPIYEAFWVPSIFTLEDFKADIRKRPFSRQIWRILKKLEILSDTLWVQKIEPVDPISYLWNLYFAQGLPLRDIKQELENMWVVYSDESSIRRLFTEQFWWTLRNQWGNGSDISKQRKRQALAWNETLHAVNMVKLQTIQDRTLSMIENTLQRKDSGKKFDIDTYNQKHNKLEKMAYVLFAHGIIYYDDITALRWFLLTSKNKFGIPTLNATLEASMKIAEILYDTEDFSDIRGWVFWNRLFKDLGETRMVAAE